MYSIEIYFKDGSVHFFEWCTILVSHSLVFVNSFGFHYRYHLSDISSISFELSEV